MPTIQDIQVILTQPSASRLAIVKVITSEDGLYGLGCATFTQRIFAVEAVIERHLKPFLIGRDVDRIEEIWNMSMVHVCLSSVGTALITLIIPRLYWSCIIAYNMHQFKVTIGRL